MKEVVGWFVLLVLLVAIEIATMGLTTIWFAAGALVATIAAACHAPLFLQITLFLFVSVLMLYFTRPVAMKYFNRDRIKTNAGSLIGMKAIVTEEIDNVKGCGQAVLNGMEWTARAEAEGITIPKGTVVLVKRIDGVKLIVSPQGEEEKEERDLV